MAIRQRREQVSQKVRVPFVEVINTSPVNFPGLLQRKVGYEVLDDVTYELVGAQGDEVHLLVKGTTIVMETYEDEASAPAALAAPSAPVYNGDAVTDTALLEQSINAPEV